MWFSSQFYWGECLCAKLLQSCQTISDSMDLCRPLGSSVHGIFQVRILEWLPLPTSRDICDPGITLTLCLLHLWHWQADSLPLLPPGKPFYWGTKVKVKPLTCVWLFVTPGTVAYQAPLSMEFSRQEYWNGLPFPSPGNLPDPGIKPRSPALQADALPSEPPGKPLLRYN